jgi:hypothetical protein
MQAFHTSKDTKQETTQKVPQTVSDCTGQTPTTWKVINISELTDNHSFCNKKQRRDALQPPDAEE